MTWGTTAAIVSAVVSAVATAASTTVQIEQAKANQKATEMALEYQRQVAQQNAELEQAQAEDAQRRGEVEAGKFMEKTRQFKSGQIAVMAAHGLDLSSGTPLDIQTGTDTAALTDLQNVMHNSALETWGHKVQQTNYEADAANLEWQKTATRKATSNQIMGSAISGIFSSAASVGGKIVDYKNGQQAFQSASQNATTLTNGVNTGNNLLTSLYGRDWEAFITGGKK